MRKAGSTSRIYVTVLAASFLLAARTPADVVEVELVFPRPELWKDSRGFTHVKMPGCPNLAQPGAPALPSRAVVVLLPPGHAATSVQVRTEEPVVLRGNHVVFPAQMPRPLGWTVPVPFTDPDPNVYHGTQKVPKESWQVALPQFLRGFALQPLLIWPVVYHPVRGTLSYSPSMAISVITKPEKTGSDRLRSRYRGFDRDFGRVSALIVNPEVLGSYPHKAGAYRNPDYRYVVITSEAIAGCTDIYTLDDLMADKHNRGISTRIDTIESIRTSHAGVDDADKIRNFIKDMYDNHGTDFVLIAGDADREEVGGETEVPVVPARYLWCSNDWWTDELPGDLYYGCLDGNFDANGNGTFGETDDQVDFYAEVWVGRVAVDNCAEVANFVRKTLSYQQSGGHYLEKVMMVGEWLWPDGPSNWGADYLERIHFSSDENNISTLGFSENPFFQVGTLYDRELGGQGAWGADDILAIINDEQHIIDHLGHSLNNYNMRLLTEQIDAGMRNTQYFFEYAQGCHCGAFDNQEYFDPEVYWQDSFAEHMTLGNRGAFAVVMNTRNGLGGYSNHVNRWFWDGMFRRGMTRLGEMHAHSREIVAAYMGQDQFMRWVVYEVTLFGDPELSFHTNFSTRLPMIGLPNEPVHFLVVRKDDNPPKKMVGIRNHGCGTLEWSVNSSHSWLMATPVSGTAPSDISLSVDVTGFPTGVLYAELTFSAPDATNTPQALPVRLQVFEVPSVVAPFIPSSPSVDGDIADGEYDGAHVLDMDPDHAGTSTARVLHDGDRIYFALEIASDLDADEQDAVLLLVDTNNDGVWPVGPDNEGLFRLVADGSRVFNPYFNDGSGMREGDSQEPTGVEHVFGTFEGGWGIGDVAPLFTLFRQPIHVQPSLLQQILTELTWWSAPSVSRRGPLGMKGGCIERNSESILM